MQTATSKKSVARIFEDVGGYYVCNDAESCLDTTGTAYKSRRGAIRAIRGQLEAWGPEYTYTHYRSGNRIVKL
jgi:hypothetical protein